MEVKETKFYCDIIKTRIYTACNLKKCGFWFDYESSCNCIRIYNNEESMEPEDISFVVSLPLWLVRELKKEALVKLKQLKLKSALKKYNSIPTETMESEVMQLERFYKANIREIINVAVTMFNSISSLHEVLKLSSLVIKNLIKLYVGNIETVLPSVKTFRKVKHRFLVRRTWHYPYKIDDMIGPFLYREDIKTSLDFKKVDIYIESLLLT